VINQILTNIGGTFANINFLINLESGLTTNGTCQMMVGSTTGLIQFELNFQVNIDGTEDPNTPLALKCGWIMGFRNGLYKNNTNYVSESIVNLEGPKYLFLIIDDFQQNVNNNYYGLLNNSLLPDNILARISINKPPFSILTQDNSNLITVAREYFGAVNLQSLKVQLIDDVGRIVNLNNMDFSFSLELTQEYDI
jgi:hypothetical protein